MSILSIKKYLGRVSHHHVTTDCPLDTHTCVVPNTHTPILVTSPPVCILRLAYSTMPLSCRTLKMEDTRLRSWFPVPIIVGMAHPWEWSLYPRRNREWSLKEWSHRIWVLMFQVSLKSSSLPTVTGNCQGAPFFSLANSSCVSDAWSAMSSD